MLIMWYSYIVGRDYRQYIHLRRINMGFDKIRALDDRQKSRDKLPIFYGSRDNYTHGFREVALNNTIDEISNNFDQNGYAHS